MSGMKTQNSDSAMYSLKGADSKNYIFWLRIFSLCSSIQQDNMFLKYTEKNSIKNTEIYIRLYE